MTQNDNQNILNIYKKLVYMVMRCMSFFQQVYLNE